MVSLRQTIKQSAIGLRGFIGALKNGQSTMAAFNAVAGLNPFTIIAVGNCCSCWCTGILQVKFNILDSMERYHGSIKRSSWLVQRECSSYYQLLAGLLVV